MPATTDTGMSTLTKALWAIVTITFVVTIILFFRTSDAMSQASLAVSTAQDANTRANVAKTMAKAVALRGDLPEPEDEQELKHMDPQERILRDMMKEQKKRDAAERIAFKKVADAVAAHEGVLATIAEDVRGNTRSIAATSNSLTAALVETDGKIRLALQTMATKAEVDALSGTARELRVDRHRADLTIASFGQRINSLSNTLATVKSTAPGGKAPKVAKTAPAVIAGDIDKDEKQIVSGVITRKGLPVVKKGWFGHESVKVTYVVTLNAPDGTDIDLGEETFQEFEKSQSGLMSDLAKVSENETERLAKLSKELTSKFGDHLKKEKKLPKEVVFIGAQAKATVVPTKNSTAKNP